MTDVARPLPHPYTPGSVRAAFSYRDYRLVWLGMFASNIGTWMQNVALPAYIQHRTRSGGLVGLTVFGQLGPVLLLSVPGGVLASKFPRRAWLVTMQSVQLVGSLVLALLAYRHASVAALIWCNVAIGTGNALGAPAFQATVPMLVDRRDLPGAISLNSTQLNGSRVVGPLIAGLLGIWGVTITQIFVINAATYLFMIAGLLVVTIPTVQSKGAAGWQQLTVGYRIARERFVVGRTLASMALFSFFSLPFVVLFSTVADVGLGVDPQSSTYKWIYATWGLGACLGALSAGTVLARVDKARLIRPSFVGFAVSLVAFGLLHGPALAYPVGFVLGWWYFLLATALITVLQQNLSDEERPYVMALWFMAFGGTVPIGGLVFGPLMDVIGPHWILMIGAVFAAFLGFWCDLRTGGEQRGRHSLEAGDPAALDQHGAAAGD